MTYAVIILKANGEIVRTEQKSKPTYEQIRQAVDGYIETVPHFTKYGDFRRGTAFCNENGIAEDKPFNVKATKEWLNNIGSDPFSYEPRLYGDVIYYAKLK